MRLIDADAIKLEKGFFENIDNVPKFYEWLEEQPTIDAVEVVHCRDCKFKQKCPTKIFGEHSDDWFCADGEKRE